MRCKGGDRMDNYADSYRRYLDGDDNGLVEIIGHFRYGLTLYINGMVKDICLAEDIMQETFVKLAVKKPGFDGRSSFPTWLYSVARNCAIDRLRKKARHKEIPLDECFEVSDETDIEKLYIREEQKIELHRAMSKLPPDYAQILYLRYFEDFDTKAAARIMRKSERQIGDLLYRAKKSLKTELERAGFTYED